MISAVNVAIDTQADTARVTVESDQQRGPDGWACAFEELNSGDVRRVAIDAAAVKGFSGTSSDESPTYPVDAEGKPIEAQTEATVVAAYRKDVTISKIGLVR